LFGLKTNQERDENALHKFLIAATLFKWSQREAKRKVLKSIPSGWRNSFYDYQKINYQIDDEKISVKYQFGEKDFLFKINDTNFESRITHQLNNEISISINGVQQSFTVNEDGQTIFIHSPVLGNLTIKEIDRFPRKQVEKIKGNHESPMPGKVLKVLIKEGDMVQVGDPLVIISSMKMENTIEAQTSGTVEEVYAEAGKNVVAGKMLLVVKEEN